MASQDPYISSVDLWPLDWAPYQWTLCNGQLLSINSYQALFALIGITYGGNGTTNFAVPDMRGRIPIGMGQRQGANPPAPNYDLAQVGGNETATLTLNSMPLHTHTAAGTVTPKAGTGKITLVTSPTNNFPGETPAANPVYTTSNNAVMGSSPVTVTVQPAGSGQAFSIMPPYICLNYIIALAGEFPARN